MEPPRKPLHPAWFGILLLLVLAAIIVLDGWRFELSDQFVSIMRLFGYDKLFFAYPWEGALIGILAGGVTGCVVIIPFWLIAKKWRAAYDRYKRWERGTCVECGYDLRGHVADEKCPECGAVIPEKVIQ